MNPQTMTLLIPRRVPAPSPDQVREWLTRKGFTLQAKGFPPMEGDDCVHDFEVWLKNMAVHTNMSVNDVYEEIMCVKTNMEVTEDALERLGLTYSPEGWHYADARTTGIERIFYGEHACHILTEGLKGLPWVRVSKGDLIGRVLRVTVYPKSATYEELRLLSNLVASLE